jgi:hypothetical protein
MRSLAAAEMTGLEGNFRSTRRILQKSHMEYLQHTFCNCRDGVHSGGSSELIDMSTQISSIWFLHERNNIGCGRS